MSNSVAQGATKPKPNATKQPMDFEHQGIKISISLVFRRYDFFYCATVRTENGAYRRGIFDSYLLAKVDAQAFIDALQIRHLRLQKGGEVVDA
jgi:hypothetical protein